MGFTLIYNLSSYVNNHKLQTLNVGKRWYIFNDECVQENIHQNNLHAIFHNIQYIHWKYTDTFTWPTYRKIHCWSAKHLKETVKRWLYTGNNANMLHTWSHTFFLVHISEVNSLSDLFKLNMYNILIQICAQK